MSQLSKMAIIGGGPAGLYAAIQMRRRMPQVEVTVYEQNPQGATFGFGVVFSDQALAFLKAADPEIHDLILPHMERWQNMTLQHPEDRITIDGVGFTALGRLELIEILRTHAGGLGIDLRFDTRIEDLAALEAELARIDPAWAKRLASGDRGVAQLIRRCQPMVGHAILLPFAEAYSVVADILARARPGDPVDEKALLDAALIEGRQAWLLRRISSEASIGKLLFANALSQMRHMGLAETATPDGLRARRALLVELRGLANVMESMRLATLALADRLPGTGE